MLPMAWNKKRKTALYGKTRKATGFKSLRANYWEINQVTSKCQRIFWIKLAQKGIIQKKWAALSNFTNSK